MKKLKVILSITALFCMTSAYADELSDSIKVGMNKLEVSGILGGSPDAEECTTILAVSKCSLVWKKGLISKTIYTVTTVADRVVAVSVQSGKILGL